MILPGGTGNGAAGEFGIPKTIAEAVGLLVDPALPSSVRSTWGKLETSACSCAVRAVLSQRSTKVRRGSSRATSAVLRTYGRGLATLGGVDQVDYRITCDGEVYEARGITCIVANGAGFGGVGSVAEGITSDDGKLDVLVFTGEGLKSPVKTAAKALPGVAKSHTLPDDAVRSGAHIVVECSNPQAIVVDGEPAGNTPMEVKVRPGALHLVVPAVPAPSAEG